MTGRTEKASVSKNFKRILRRSRSKMRLVPFFIKLLRKSGACFALSGQSYLCDRKTKWANGIEKWKWVYRELDTESLKITNWAVADLWSRSSKSRCRCNRMSVLTISQVQGRCVVYGLTVAPIAEIPIPCKALHRGRPIPWYRLRLRMQPRTPYHESYIRWLLHSAYSATARCRCGQP